MSFDELYDEVLEAELRATAAREAAVREPFLQVVPDESDALGTPGAAEAVVAAAQGPRGFTRYRNATLVGAGGLACAAVGALMGGLGGYLTVKPAAAHPVASSTKQDPSLDGAVSQASRLSSAVSGSAAVTGALFSLLSGSLVQSGAAPSERATSSDPGNPLTPPSWRAPRATCPAAA